MDTQNIFLLGFMGSGKTKLGKRLSKLLKYSFIDLDKMIEEKEERSISKIFEESGEDYFRKKESEYLCSINNKHTTVVAVGGGTPCFHNNMDWMLQHGKCVWIKVSNEELFRRLKDTRDNRPLLRNLTDAELKDFIQKKLEERTSYYSRAHLIIQSDGLKEQTLADKISDLYRKSPEQS